LFFSRNRFDEEKCVECQICKKPFKNGSALNGHMRLHGGFNEVYYIKDFSFIIIINFDLETTITIIK
jgi:hypothetical protein